MDPLQQLLTQRALAQAQGPNQGGVMPQPPMPQQGQLPNSGFGDSGGAISQMLGSNMGSPSPDALPLSGYGQSGAGAPGMSMNAPHMGMGNQPGAPMRMPQAPQQQSAPYQPQDSANDRNYV